MHDLQSTPCMMRHMLHGVQGYMKLARLVRRWSLAFSSILPVVTSAVVTYGT